MLIGVFDLEATDKDPGTARITQAAVSLFDTDDKWREVYHYSSLCYKSDYPELNEVAALITGITRLQLEVYGRDTDHILESIFLSLSDCDFVCGHNVRNYDINLLRAETSRLSIDCPDFDNVIDTRFDIDWPSHIDTRKLLYLAAEYGYANPMSHSARHDVDATAFLLKQFKIDGVIERSKSPDIKVQAKVTYDTKELAKARKFSWDGDKKMWVKQIKELDLIKEQSFASFDIVVIK